MTLKIKHITLALVTILLLVICSCENLEEDFNVQQFENPIKIAVVSDISISRASAENIILSTQLAAKEINASGGLRINGTKHEIELIHKDSGGNPELGLEVIAELQEQEVNLIVGPSISAVALDMAEYCIQENMLMISFSATIPSLSTLNDNDLVWRTCPSDEFSGQIMSAYAYDSLNFRNAAIFHRNDNFGNSLAKIIQNNFELLGGNILSVESYPASINDQDDYNYAEKLNLILSQNPEIIFVSIFERELIKITQDLWNSPVYQSMPVKPKIFLSEGGYEKDLLTGGQTEILESIIGISSTVTSTDNYIRYKENFFQRYNFDPLSYSEHAYDAVYAYAYAIQKAQSTDPNIVKNHLRAVTGGEGSNDNAVEINVNEFTRATTLIDSDLDINYQGASGKIDFDSNGDPLSRYAIWGFQNGNVITFSIYNK